MFLSQVIPYSTCTICVFFLFREKIWTKTRTLPYSSQHSVTNFGLPECCSLQVFVPSWQLMSRSSSVSPLEEHNWWPLLHRRSSRWSAAERALSLWIMGSLCYQHLWIEGLFIKAGSFEGCWGKEDAIKYNQILSFLFIERSLQWLCGRADRV